MLFFLTFVYKILRTLPFPVDNPRSKPLPIKNEDKPPRTKFTGQNTSGKTP